MPRISRRVFAAAMFATSIPPGSSLAQEATPTTGGSPEDVLREYISAIIQDGNVSAVPDYFDGEHVDINATILQQADILGGVHDDDKPVTVDVRVICGDSEEAIALVEFWSNDYNTRALFIAVVVRNGKIVGYRWMAQASDRSN